VGVGWQGSTACALACAALVAGCGDDGAKSPGATKGPPETTDKSPRLPPRWRRVVNLRAGFTVGIPPGWTARGSTGTTLVRSNDRALGLTIDADRGDEGRELSPRQYAARVASQLRDLRRLRTGTPKPVRGMRYPTASVTASGTSISTGVPQAIVVYALSRPQRVTYSFVVFRSARTPASRYQKLLDTLLRSFTAKPARP
jgi:hypothetical protein